MNDSIRIHNAINVNYDMASDMCMWACVGRRVVQPCRACSSSSRVQTSKRTYADAHPSRRCTHIHIRDVRRSKAVLYGAKVRNPRAAIASHSAPFRTPRSLMQAFLQVCQGGALSQVPRGDGHLPFSLPYLLTYVRTYLLCWVAPPLSLPARHAISK